LFEDAILLRVDWYVPARLSRSLLICIALLVGASQVRWNRYNPSLLASAHDGEVRIWDIRVSIQCAVNIY
jgi:hypothetical protein